MNVVHLTSWLSAAGGGIPPVIRALVGEFRHRQLDCTVAGLADPTGALPAFPDDWPVLAGRIAGPAALGYSHELRSLLHARCSTLGATGDIVHVHGLWMYPGVLARQLSRRTGAKRIVSPHGMLEPWALQNSRWKKRAAGWVFENRNLQTADCLHALCAPEAENFRHYGLKNPIAVIPNGVDLGAFENPPARSMLESLFPALKGRRWVLFLSRLHPKKGLPHLLHAWKSVVSGQSSSGLGSDWTLVIAGPDELGHKAEMKQLATELGIAWQDGNKPDSSLHAPCSVLFSGPLHGEEKMAALAGSELFVLPSFSEGFSMAVLEAAAAGLPVMLTPQCNFPELAKADGAIEVLPDAVGCEAGLRQLLSLSDAERQSMGQRGREMVAAHYTWARVADQMLSVYNWLLGRGPKPDCVV